MLNNFDEFGTVSAAFVELQNFSKYIDHFVIKNLKFVKEAFQYV